MDDLLNFTLLTFGSLIAILDPVGIIPQYLAFTANLNVQEKKEATKRAALVAGSILFATSLVGTLIFSIFGITAPAFKVAGGVILFIIALDMLNVRTQRSKTSPEEHTEGVEKQDVSIFPLAVPLIAGPGSITTTMMLGEKANNLIKHSIVIVAVIICVTALYFILIKAIRISYYLGHIGMNVLTRLMGLILAAIAAQFIIDGFLEATR